MRHNGFPRSIGWDSTRSLGRGWGDSAVLLGESKASIYIIRPDRKSYGEDSRGDRYVHTDELCTQLDRWMADDTMNDQQTFRENQAAAHEESERNRQIDESLRSTIAAFAARWLPLAPSSVKGKGDKLSVIQDLWRHSRRDMLRVINRPSYRSMLALFLFGLTPIPAGISDDEELDGISGQSCIHAGLQHIQILRARQRNLQFSGAKVSPYLKKQAIPTSPESLGISDFMHAESTAYWAALTFDTSASLTLNCRSLLSSGLFGHSEELSWRLVRTCGKMFDEIAQQWQPGSLDMTDDRANQIVGAGAAWKLLGWKLTAVFKEALRDGHEEEKVQAAYRDVVESIQYFNATFRPHLEACQSRMQFLGQQTKLRWCKLPLRLQSLFSSGKTNISPDSLMLHYHLSILMFFDIIEATERYDLMADVREINIEAENTVMNTLVFGLHNTYTVSMTPTGPIMEDSSKPAVTIPLTSIDPYPHHIVAGVQLVRKAIERDFGLGKIAEESHASLQSTLERTLSLLPQCSKSVEAARTKLSGKIPDTVGEHYQDPYRILHANFAD